MKKPRKIPPFWSVACPVFAIGFFTGVFLSHLTSSPLAFFETKPVAVNIIEPSTAFEVPSYPYHPPEVRYTPLGPEFTEERWWEDVGGDRTLYVAPYTGLANTLQAMGSALTIAHRHKINIQVLPFLVSFLCIVAV